MSELFGVSTELAPAFVDVANLLGASVLRSASDRIADQSVARGEGFFRRLFTANGRGSGGLSTDDAERADELDALIERLGPDERRQLVEALRAWLDGPRQDLDEGHLLHHVRRIAQPQAAPVTYNTAHAYAPGSIAANSIGTIHVQGDSGAEGRGPQGRSGSEGER
ncbi:hypothetical protein ACFWZ2_19240 [Streptomyces sp. NPDC059002]|uniref:hypothetical protein n=1 Tax=Streptomyces sp. NPDC059002 TaxID=3346690 RepID=UPI003687CD1A